MNIGEIPATLTRVRDLKRGDRFYWDTDGQTVEVVTVSVDVFRPDVVHVHLLSPGGAPIVPEYTGDEFVEVVPR